MACPNLRPSTPETSRDSIESSMATMSLEASSSALESAPGSASEPSDEVTTDSTPLDSADAEEVEVTRPFVPLTEFRIFPNFPPEIRIKIFKCAAHLGRVVEVQAQSGPYPAGVLQWFGPDFATTAAASRIPPVLHTSREAREAALPLYTLRVLGASTLSTSPKVRLFYFNIASDTLLFGKGCGFNGVIKKALAENVTTRQPIARIAIDMNELSGPAELLEFLKEMHGYPRGEAGCIGLEEITFVIPTKGWGCDSVIINDKWDLLPTRNNGLTANQIIDTKHARDMAWWTGFCGGNLTINHHLKKWVSFDGDVIKFKFCSLRPIGREDNKVRDAVNVSPADILVLTEHNGYILNQIERILGIEIDLPSPDMNPALPAGATSPLYGHDDKCMEVGITGINKWQVEKGIRAIKDFLVQVAGLSGSDLEISGA